MLIQVLSEKVDLYSDSAVQTARGSLGKLVWAGSTVQEPVEGRAQWCDVWENQM